MFIYSGFALSATLLSFIRKDLLPTTRKETDTESLSDPTNGYTFEVSFCSHQFIRHFPVPDELTANVLFAAESYPLLGKLNGGDVVAALSKVLLSKHS